MPRYTFALLCCLIFLPLTKADDKQQKSTNLTPQEIAMGWILLFDGETTFGWKTDGDVKIEQGELILGGDKASTIQTTTAFGNGIVSCKFRYLTDKQEGSVSLTSAKEEGTRELNVMPGQGPQQELTLVFAGNKILFAMYGGGAFKSVKEQSPSCSPIGFSVKPGTRLMLSRIAYLPEGAQSLFTGKDLTGWKEVKNNRAKSVFSVTDKGELNIKNGPGDLHTEGEWDDFILQLDVISNGKHLNSGVFFRCVPGAFWSGYEAQIRNQWKEDDRAKPVDFGTGGLYNRQQARKVVSSDNEYLTMTVIAHGPHIAIWVNGYQTVDFTDNAKDAASARQGRKLGKGPISLQGHDPTTDLSFKNIRIAPLAKAEK